MKLTPVNAYVLATVFRDGDRVPNRLEPTAAPHLRRCVKLGLVRIESRKVLVLTPTGAAVVAAEKAKVTR